MQPSPEPSPLLPPASPLWHGISPHELSFHPRSGSLHQRCHRPACLLTAGSAGRPQTRLPSSARPPATSIRCPSKLLPRTALRRGSTWATSPWSRLQTSTTCSAPVAAPGSPKTSSTGSTRPWKFAAADCRSPRTWPSTMAPSTCPATTPPLQGPHQSRPLRSAWALEERER